MLIIILRRFIMLLRLFLLLLLLVVLAVLFFRAEFEVGFENRDLGVVLFLLLPPKPKKLSLCTSAGAVVVLERTRESVLSERIAEKRKGRGQ